MSPLNELEWWGWSIKAEHSLCVQGGSARILMELVRRSPAIVPMAALADASAAGKWAALRTGSFSAVRVRVCQLREALRDIGLPRAIRSHRAVGYSMDTETAADIRQRVLNGGFDAEAA